MATGAHATALQLSLWSVRLWFVLSNSTGMCSLWRDHAIDHRLSSNKSVFSLVNLAVNMILPASASGRRAAAPLMPAPAPPLSINMLCPQGAQQQTRRTLQRLS